MNLKARSNVYFYIILFVILLMYVPLFTLKYKTIFNLTEEDHLYENFPAYVLPDVFPLY